MMASSRRSIPEIGAAETFWRNAGIGIGGCDRMNSTTLINVSSSNSPCRTNGQIGGRLCLPRTTATDSASTKRDGP